MWRKVQGLWRGTSVSVMALLRCVTLAKFLSFLSIIYKIKIILLTTEN